VRIRYVTEPEPRGTAGAIRFAADALGDELGERFLALNGDVLTDLDLSALMRAHAEGGARATIGLYPVDDSSAYGLVSSDGEGAVSEFLEKTGTPVPGEINAGLYVLERSVLDLVPAGERSRSSARSSRGCRRGPRGLRSRATGWTSARRERYLQASWDILEGGGDAGRADRPGVLSPPSAEIAAGAGRPAGGVGPAAGRRRRRVASRSCSTAARRRGRPRSRLDPRAGRTVAAGARSRRRRRPG
jgi:mannose-1-phosphate guanylyltransferase